MPLQMEYTTGAVPLFLILLSLACWEIKRKFNLPVAAGVVLLLLFTNFIHVLPWYAVKLSDQAFALRARLGPENYVGGSIIGRSILNARIRFVFFDYIQEISHDFDSSLKAIANYINAHKKPTDTFLAAHEDMEVAYYTQLKPAVEFPFKTPPAWIIPRKNYKLNPYHKMEPKEVKLERHYKIMDFIKTNGYKEIVLDSIDLGIENSTNIEVHRFRKPQTRDPQDRTGCNAYRANAERQCAVVIYHKETSG
ncbi:MAG: hypothetical protein VYC17_00885 [Nitrospinota bacterium]|nr:hypothetical protein [Nitrospinota bacterium]